MTIDQIMRAAPVIPVLVLEGEGDWQALAKIFVDAGLPVIEVTLRTPSALSAINAMTDVPGATVGAGTVLNQIDLDKAIDAGAKFIVSPGLTPSLGKCAIDNGIPFLPGVANASDIMLGLELGLDRFKFFPAEAAGGVKTLKALSAPFGRVRFCPTGGITTENAADWLALESVLCVGGTWLYRGSTDKWSVVAERARAAAALRGIDRRSGAI